MNEHRIYVIVPKTVQSPLEDKVRRNRIIRVATKQTKTTVQPVGRIGAQACHVVSKMRLDRFLQHSAPNLIRLMTDKAVTEQQRALDLEQFTHEVTDEGITTIILSVPDSFWLEHVHSLMRAKKIKTFEFIDTNEEYGGGSAKTAICTLPINPASLDGIIDYLPLWVHP